jgi:tetratricopeptide (TPR) repeat protein
VQAEHEAQQDRVVEAQRLLTDLADRFPTNRLAPYALYQASTYADRLGRNDNFQEADRLLERLVTTYPQSELVFDARLKQGDLLRKLNQFPQAQRAYESLIKNPLYVNNPNSILARLALAECHNAQSGTDPLHEESARSLFEDICEYRVDAPVDIRVEAGYNLGNIYRHRGRLNLAKEVWWSDVVKAFLINPLKASELGSTGRFWMAKTLMDLAQLFNEQGQIDQAIQAWQRVIEADLPGAALAKSNITNLNSPAAKF